MNTAAESPGGAFEAAGGKLPFHEALAAVSEQAVSRRFTYHPPRDGQPERYVRIRQMAGDFARELLTLCPASPELDRAIDHLDETVMLANAAIARNERGGPGGTA